MPVRMPAMPARLTRMAGPVRTGTGIDKTQANAAPAPPMATDTAVVHMSERSVFARMPVA